MLLLQLLTGEMGMNKFFSICAFAGLLVLLATSCYRMPNDDDYCVIPTTNNRDITGDTNATAGIPGLGY